MKISQAGLRGIQLSAMQEFAGLPRRAFIDAPMPRFAAGLTLLCRFLAWLYAALNSPADEKYRRELEAMK